MSVIDLIGVGFSTVLTPMGIALMFVGVAVGIVFGALPGLSATMAIALFLPVTYARRQYEISCQKNAAGYYASRSVLQ